MLKKFMDRLEILWVAITYAEAGELAEARNLLKPERTILLVLRKTEIKPEVLDYVFSLCQRIQAGLEIFSNTIEPLLIENFLKKLYEAGIYHLVIPYEDFLEETVIDYANTHSGIAFVVVDSLERDERGNQWCQLTCPLVVANLASHTS